MATIINIAEARANRANWSQVTEHRIPRTQFRQAYADALQPADVVEELIIEAMASARLNLVALQRCEAQYSRCFDEALKALIQLRRNKPSGPTPVPPPKRAA